MKNVALSMLVFLSLGSMVYAQHMGGGQVGGEGEYQVIHTPHGDIPRFSAQNENVLIVPVGETVTLPENSEYFAIEVAGTLKVSREHNTLAKFVHLTVLPGGKLDLGTSVDPIPPDIKKEALE